MKIFYVMGYGWSGSSILVDYFSDYYLTAGLKGSEVSETKLFGKNLCPLNFVSKANKDLLIDINCIIALLTGGRYEYSRSKNFKDIDSFLSKGSNKNKLNFNELGNTDIAESIDKIFDQKTLIGKQEFLDKYVMLINHLIKKIAKIKRSEIFCFDNDPNLYYFGKASLLPESKAILVIRNPKDIFVERIKKKNPRNTIHRLFFFISLIRNHIKVFRIIKNIEKNEEINIVQFESFVLKTEYRKKIVAHLALSFNENNKQIFNNHFNPQISKKNIDIYKSFLTFYEKFMINIFLNKKFQNFKISLVIYEKLYDKRATLKEKDQKRRLEKIHKNY